MRALIFLSSFLFVTTLFGQNITFDQTQNLRKKSLADVEAFLTAKGWKMMEAEEETEEKMGSAVFGYDVNQFDSEKATSWIIFYPSSFGTNYNRLSIQVNKPSQYTIFIGRLTANGYKLKKSSIVDGGIEKVYQNDTLTCVVKTSTVEGNYSKSTSYSFFFINSMSYKLNFEDEE